MIFLIMPRDVDKNHKIINHGLLQSTSTMILFCRDVTTPQRVAINGANV